MRGRGLSVRIATVAVVLAAALGTLPVLGTPAASAATSKNLIKNPGAEKAAGSTDGSVVPVPGWTVTTGTMFTAVQYGASGGFPVATDPGPKNRGKNFFAGGDDGTVVASQTDSLKNDATAIAGGGVTFKLSGFFGGFGSQEDNALVEVDFKDKHGVTLFSTVVGPVTAEERNDVTGLLKRSTSGSVPIGSVKALVQLSINRTSGTYNDGYADALSLTLVNV
jgi:hypothetical protein